jgi:membrane fusion protein (multidrug efflux system)
VLVPEQALVPIGSDQFVYKVVDGKAQLAKVKTGERRDAVVEVVEGLSPGDTVVTAGQIKLRNGVPVQIAPQPGV